MDRHPSLFGRIVRFARELHSRLGLKYRADRMRGYVRLFGIRDAKAAYRQIWTPGATASALSLPGITHPVWLRPGTADASAFDTVFVWRQYDLAYPFEPRIILDGGAHVGLASLFFTTRFPRATILAVEPEARNFDLLIRNTKHHGAVRALRGAIWSDRRRLVISNPGARTDSYRYVEPQQSSADAVEAYDIPTLMGLMGTDRIDILKLDIEGAEREVFSAGTDWLRSVGMVIVELHGEEAREAFFSATRHLAGHHFHSGESDVWTNG